MTYINNPLKSNGSLLNISGTSVTTDYSSNFSLSSGISSLTIDLANTSVVPGTYKSVTVDAKGRITAGTNPTTLNGFGITDAQPLNSNLTAIASLAATGLISRTGSTTAVSRTIVGTTNQITVNNGDGVLGNPTLGLASNTIIPGTGSLTVPSGTTAQRAGSNGAIRYNSELGTMEFYHSNTWNNYAPQRPGQILRSWFNSIASVAISGATYPYSTVAPSITTGAEIWRITITPIDIDSDFYIISNIDVDTGTNNRDISIALFRNTICIGLVTTNVDSAGRPQVSTIVINDSPNTTLPITYSARIFSDASTTIYVNRSSSSGTYFGGLYARKGYLIMEQ